MQTSLLLAASFVAAARIIIIFKVVIKKSIAHLEIGQIYNPIEGYYYYY